MTAKTLTPTIAPASFSTALATLVRLPPSHHPPAPLHQRPKALLQHHRFPFLPPAAVFLAAQLQAGAHLELAASETLVACREGLTSELSLLGLLSSPSATPSRPRKHSPSSTSTLHLHQHQHQHQHQLQHAWSRSSRPPSSDHLHSLHAPALFSPRRPHSTPLPLAQSSPSRQHQHAFFDGPRCT